MSLTCEQEEEECHNESVAKVEESGGGSLQIQLGVVVVDGVEEEVEGSEAARQERAPPPAVVLRAQMEVAEEDGGLRARDDQDEIDNGQEAEHVVELMRPQAVQDEEELNEDAAEGQYAAHEDAGQRTRVQVLRGYLTRYLVGAHRVLDESALEAQIRADEDERRRHQEPQGEQRYQRRERNGRRAAVHPQHQVEHEEDGEHNTSKTNKQPNELLDQIKAIFCR